MGALHELFEDQAPQGVHAEAPAEKKGQRGAKGSVTIYIHMLAKHYDEYTNVLEKHTHIHTYTTHTLTHTHTHVHKYTSGLFIALGLEQVTVPIL